MKITNRTVLIVGGTSGIGRGLARRFVDAGSTVIVGGRKPEPQDELGTGRRSFGKRALAGHHAVRLTRT
ncbi:SDR family NAD(P)-dependent oxidoreductase [Nonomuraea jabiensis]|uniref:SDR family NAD(P)-dependent oxidoreductase n=1 Tax=Nonomuraea jabiensis TaxID=882448 RepID=UPI00368A6FCC